MAGDRVHELGLAPVAVFNGCDPLGFVIVDQPDCVAPSLAAWYRHRFEAFDLQVTAFAGVPTFVGAGASLAWRVVDRESVVVAPKLGAGFLWAGLSVPVALRITDGLWWWVEPGGYVRFAEMARVGTGVFWSHRSGFALGAEVGAGYNGSVQGDAGVLVGWQF
jgi:hypothetical protein